MWAYVTQVTSSPSLNGDLRLGHIFDAAGLADSSDVIVIRHTLKEDGFAVLSDVTPAKVLAYTRVQRVSTQILPKNPTRLWLIFIADGGLRARFFTAYENRGELAGERTNQDRVYDLHESEVLSALKGRLVIEWSRDAVRWAKLGPAAASFPVVEIADPEVVPFPGFDRVRISHDVLRDVVDDSRYASWRTALLSVQGIYLIADTSTGKLYVGKADGSERILGRLDRVCARRPRRQCGA